MKNMPSTQTNKVRKMTQYSFYWDHVLTQLSKNEKRPQYIYIKSILFPCLNKVVMI